MRLANDSPSFTPVHAQIRAIGPRDLHLAKGRGPRLRGHQTGEAVNNLFANTCDQVLGVGLRVGSIVFRFNEPQCVTVDGAQVNRFDVIPHLCKMKPIKWPVIKLGHLPIIRKLKCKPINGYGFHRIWVSEA
jgi:hypothetical protein